MNDAIKKSRYKIRKRKREKMNNNIQTGEGPTKKKKNNSSKKPSDKPSKPKAPTIKDRIKTGSRVYVGDRGGLYIIFDNKHHRVKC